MKFFLPKLSFLICLFYTIFFLSPSCFGARSSLGSGEENENKAPQINRSRHTPFSSLLSRGTRDFSSGARILFAQTTLVLRKIRKSFPPPPTTTSTSTYANIRKIQKTIRGHNARRNFLQLQNAIRALQSEVRRRPIQRSFLQLKKTITFIQATVRDRIKERELHARKVKYYSEKMQKKKQNFLFALASWTADLPLGAHERILGQFKRGGKFDGMGLWGHYGVKRPPIFSQLAKWRAATQASLAVPLSQLAAARERARPLCAIIKAKEDAIFPAQGAAGDAGSDADYHEAHKKLVKEKACMRDLSLNVMGRMLYRNYHALTDEAKSLLGKKKKLEAERKAAKFRCDKLFFNKILKFTGNIVTADIFPERPASWVNRWGILAARLIQKQVRQVGLNDTYKVLQDLEYTIEDVQHQRKEVADQLKLFTPYLTMACMSDDSTFIAEDKKSS